MTYETDSIFWVEVEKIVPNPYQPRHEFDESKLRELGESIRMYGLLQPLTVTRREVMSEDGSFRSEYELIAGERRLRAAKLMGLAQVPVIIRSDEQSEMMKLELAIIENLQREDLNPVDRARAFKQLMDQFELSATQIGKKMGRSREYVSNSVRLLQLPETILSALQRGEISDGHARTLLMLNGKDEEQDTLFRETLLKKLSVREVERLARKVATDKVRKKNWDVDPEVLEMEKKLTESLGTRVQISKTDYGGKLVIDYFSDEDLQKLLTVMNQEERAAQTAATQPSNVETVPEDPQEESPGASGIAEDTPPVASAEPGEESTPKEPLESAPVRASYFGMRSEVETPVDTPASNAAPAAPLREEVPPTQENVEAEETEKVETQHAEPTPVADRSFSIDQASAAVEQRTQSAEPQRSSKFVEQGSEPERTQNAERDVAHAPEEVSATNNESLHAADASNSVSHVPQETPQSVEPPERPEPSTAEATQQSQETEEKKEETGSEDELYSIKNFSL